jgi:hypothetical protein
MGWIKYDDIGLVYEVSAVYDDRLKSDQAFTDYAVKVANRILQDLGIKAYATYGKWGARLEPSVNPDVAPQDLEWIGKQIMEHPSWLALKISTAVFTYSKSNEEVYNYQSKARSFESKQGAPE